jgi:2-(1,2-epoxy-1,2-dihydrophenyl)acetyl-CoA isomerase
MIYKVYTDNVFQDELMKFVQHLAKQATKGLGLTKKALNQAFENDFEAQLKVEEKLQQQAGQTQDYTEGVKAFQEKRKPNFRGK